MVEEISVLQLLGILYRRLPLMITGMLLAGILGGVFSYYAMDNVFQATSTIIVSNQAAGSTQDPLTYNDYTLNVKLVDSYSVLSKTNRVLDQVIAELGLTMSTKALASKISISAAKNTEIINISVTDTNPYMAQNIANSVTRVFQQEVIEIMKMDNVQIIDEAPLPTVPISPNRPMNIAISCLVGLVFGAMLAFLIEFLDRTVKTTEQAEALLEVPVLASIPKIQNE